MSPHFLTGVNRWKRRFLQAAAVLALLLFILPACTNPAAEEPAAAQNNIQLQRFSTPQESKMEHFVAAIDEELFIGVAVAQPGTNEEEPRSLAVYLCDGTTVSRWIVDEITGQQATVVDGETRVELTVADESVAGTVGLDGEQPRPFTAELATGDAGLYRAEWNLAGVDYQADWIVLADGRQRGGLDGKGNDIIILPP